MPIARPNLQQNGNRVRRFALVVVPGFGLFAYAACVQALTVANRTINRSLYKWSTVSVASEAVCASNSVPIFPDRTIKELDIYDEVLLFSSTGAPQYDNPALLTWLRLQARNGARVGGITAGTWILARAGLLGRHACTLHWMDIPAFKETYPELRTSDGIYTIDSERFSTAGGSATVDLMLAIFAKDLAQGELMRISDDMLHGRHRGVGEAQRVKKSQYDPRIGQVISAMEEAIECPRSIPSLCQMIKVNQRTLEALFNRNIGVTPKRFYLNMRLERAHFLLGSGAVSVTTAALAVGFTDISAFSTAYRKWRGVSPRETCPS